MLLNGKFAQDLILFLKNYYGILIKTNIDKRGHKPYLDARTLFLYFAPANTPAMAAEMVGKGS